MPDAIRCPGTSETHVAALAVSLVRAGVLRRADWRGPEPTPSGLLRNAWARRVGRARRGAPDAMDIHLVLAPWTRVLERHGVEPRPADEAHLAITLDAGMCTIVPLDELRHHWGETGAGLVAAALRRGLGRVIHVWAPGDLEWVVEWWRDSLECLADEEDEDREFEEARIKQFEAAHEQVTRTCVPLPTRESVVAALGTLPAGPVRRGVAALLAEARSPRTLWPTRALERLQGDHGHPTAAVLLTGSANDPVRHAYDMIQEDAANSGERGPPHGVLLIDTRSPARLAVTLRQAHRVLRTLAWGEHLVRAIQTLHDGDR